MTHNSERRRVLIASSHASAGALRELFCRDPLNQWLTLEADSFSRARFVLQHNACDVLVVQDDLYEREGGQGLAWLSWQREVPIVLLVGQAPERYARAFQLGVSVCLPSDQAMGHPAMLAAGLDHAVGLGEISCGFQRAQEQLAQSRRHVDRLVNLLWRATPRHQDQDWFPQRYMLERLSEELSRTSRHGIPLAVALGEIALEGHPDGGHLPEWVHDSILQVKRRCDVAGQYGPQSFLLLMVHTPKEGAMTCCRRLQTILEQNAHVPQGPHRPMQSFFGVAALSPDRNTPQAILRCAEENLQAARARTEERIAVA